MHRSGEPVPSVLSALFASRDGASWSGCLGNACVRRRPRRPSPAGWWLGNLGRDDVGVPDRGWLGEQLWCLVHEAGLPASSWACRPASSGNTSTISERTLASPLLPRRSSQRAARTEPPRKLPAPC